LLSSRNILLVRSLISDEEILYNDNVDNDDDTSENQGDNIIQVKPTITQGASSLPREIRNLTNFCHIDPREETK
jgi:hypothetical protein